MDTIDGSGYNGQQKAICDACGLCQMMHGALKSVFCRFQLIGYTTKLFRCLDVDIWRQTTDKLITLPLAHVRGVIIFGFRRRITANTCVWLIIVHPTTGLSA